MTAAGKPPRGLGRGLDVLLPTRREPPTSSGQSYGAGNVFECPIEKIVPQPGQPRQHFDGEKLDELATSLREHGLIEPLVVRRRGEQFELVAGERRWRAAQRAGLREVLVVVRDLSARDAYELAIVENIQREDLNAIELAEALQRLVSEHGYTQESLAERLGKDRSTVANALRLLKLPERIRRLVVAGQLTEGHARALLGVADGAELERLADRVVKGKLNVRQTEALVRGARPGGGAAPPGGGKKSAATRDLELRLARKLGTRCEVRDRDGKG
ncbi:MAG: ParB/RepB/Spo0J family partition protein, partial [Deltaproteobacteria bacterium]|nr:ParB/RepB/Spo0J family partition protein [Deltaproteobacteria bacterium]